MAPPPGGTSLPRHTTQHNVTTIPLNRPARKFNQLSIWPPSDPSNGVVVVLLSTLVVEEVVVHVVVEVEEVTEVEVSVS